MNNRKWIGAVAVATVGTSLIVTGCGSSNSAGTNNTGSKSGNSILKVAQNADAVTLDPQKTNDESSAVVMDQIYNTLIDLTPKMKLKPELATKWTRVNPTTWKFTLRKGVTFQNGDKLTASDVKFTFDRLLNPKTASPGAFVLAQVKGVKVLGPYSFDIMTKKPFAPILYNLTHTATSILDKKAVTQEGANYGQHPVGTGPFKFVSWKKNSSINLTRYSHYYAGAAKLKGLDFEIIPESSTASAELRTGQVDVVLQMPPAQVSQFKGAKNVTINEAPGFDLKYLSFDNRKKPFNNKLVREAINYAVNKQNIVKVAYQGAAVVGKGPLPPGIDYTDPNIKGYSYNPQKAKQLLSQAGYPNGFTTTLYLSSSSLNQKVATIVQSQLANVGIKVNLKVMQWGSFLNKTAQGVPMFILDWITVTGDADNGMYALWDSKNFGGPGNRSFYKNSKVNQWLQAGQTQLNKQKRKQDYYNAQKQIMKDAPADFLAVGKNIVGLNKNVQGFVNMPTMDYHFYHVTLK